MTVGILLSLSLGAAEEKAEDLALERSVVQRGRFIAGAPASVPAPPAPQVPTPPTAPQPAITIPSSPGVPGFSDPFEHVQRHAREVEEQMRAVQRHIQEGMGGAMSSLHQNLAGIRMGFTGPGATRFLVIPGVDLSSEDVASLQEDLAVMHRILMKSTESDGAKRGGFRMDVGTVRLGDRGELDALYLQDYGAVFFLVVDYPLAPVEPVSEAPEPVAQETEDLWQSTRREVLRQGGGAAAGSTRPVPIGSSRARSTAATPSPRRDDGYREERVEQLQEHLKTALLQGVNIKQLKPDDFLTLVVSGEWVAAGEDTMSGGHGVVSGVVGGGSGTGGQHVERFHRFIPGSMPTEKRRQTSLHMRVAVRDLMAHQEGKLPTEQLWDRVQIQKRVDPVQ